MEGDRRDDGRTFPFVGVGHFLTSGMRVDIWSQRYTLLRGCERSGVVCVCKTAARSFAVKTLHRCQQHLWEQQNIHPPRRVGEDSRE